MTSQSHEGPKTERVREKWMFCMCERHGLGQPGRRDSCQEYLVGGGSVEGRNTLHAIMLPKSQTTMKAIHF